MKKCEWIIHEYWRTGMTATDDMADHMNEMSRKGYEVYKITQMPRRAELSHCPNKSGSLGDGDHFSISTTTRIYYRK